MSNSVEEKTDTFLEHYGVKGMKWGVRRSTVDKVSTTVGNAASKVRNSKVFVPVAVAAGTVGFISRPDVAITFLLGYGAVKATGLDKKASRAAKKFVDSITIDDTSDE